MIGSTLVFWCRWLMWVSAVQPVAMRSAVFWRVASPITNHLKLHASNYRQKANHPEHPNHPLIQHTNPPRNMKTTPFLNTADLYTTPNPNQITTEEIKNNIKNQPHNSSPNLSKLTTNNQLTNLPPTDVDPGLFTKGAEK